MKKDYISTYIRLFGEDVCHLISVPLRKALALGYKLVYLKSNRVINESQVKKLVESAVKNGNRFVHDGLVLLASELLEIIGKEEFMKLELIDGERADIRDDEDLGKCLIVIDGQHRIQACIENEELNINLLLTELPEGMSIEKFVRLYNSCSNRWSRINYIDSHLQTGELENKMYLFSRRIATETGFSDKAAEYLCTGSREGAKLQDLIDNTIEYVIFSIEKCKAALVIAEVVRHLNEEALLKGHPRTKKADTEETRKANTEKRENAKKVMRVRKFFYTIDFIDILGKTHITGEADSEWSKTVASFLLSLTDDKMLRLYTQIVKDNNGQVEKEFLKIFNAFLSDESARGDAMKHYNETDIKKITSPVSE